MGDGVAGGGMRLPGWWAVGWVVFFWNAEFWEGVERMWWAGGWWAWARRCGGCGGVFGGILGEKCVFFEKKCVFGVDLLCRLV